VGPATPPETVTSLAHELPEGIYMGTSSWSFPGWNGIVYDRSVSQTVLAHHGLAAYAQHPLLRTVGIDRTFYAPIAASDFAEYAEAVPEHFRFVVKAHEMVTRARTKDDLAAPNPTFLDVGYAMEEVIGPCLEGLGDRAAILLLQFPPQRVDSVTGFAEKLHRFLKALPRELIYALELRNPELLSESYTEAIRDVGACHCFNVHPTMPSLAEQARRIDPASSPAVVVRWMLRRNRTYADAKDTFYPFDKLAEPDDDSRKAIATLCREAQRAFVVVNNKAEGSAPLSVIRLAEEILVPSKP
jgi:uncharacterized protein YecE (DUF72 family)